MTIGAIVVPAAQAGTRLDPAALAKAIEIVPVDHAAGDLARVVSGADSWQGTDGDLQTGQAIAPNAHFRIGSVAKSFEATIALQLVAEHRIDLEQTVEHYLPGLLTKPFRVVTVRQVLTMTSGLPEVGGPSVTIDQLIANRFDYQLFDEIIQQSLRPKKSVWPGPRFPAGTRQSYNSLDYRVVGALVEKVTGKPYPAVLRERIVRPLSLTQTAAPGVGPRLPVPYLHGYLTNSKGQVVDVSEQNGNPSSMYSTTTDLDRFVTALFRGDLLPAAQNQVMFSPPRDANGNLLPYQGAGNCNTGLDAGKACLGMGVGSLTLPNGTVLWGKTGEDMGYSSGVFATRDLSERGEYAVAETTTNDPMTVPRRLLAAAFSN
ncbi:serine hydrolase domain-containing protein [Fodinicola feengrottensis]|uniref:Serine hydrolase domain-containing protein n=1 Tax=Fodinicola feengrottensis TaxID=435914 RepID=A0ABN2HFM7_9ACTN